MSGRPIWLLLLGLALTLGVTSAGHADEGSACGTGTSMEELRSGKVIENEYVRASLVQLQPGDTRAVPAARHRIAFAVGTYDIERSFNGGATDVSADPGDVHRVMSRPHQVRNVGTTEAVFLEIQSLVTPLRPDPPGPSEYNWSADHDLTKIAPDQARLRFDDAQFHVVDVSLAGGESLPPVWHLTRIVLPDQRYELRYQADDGRVQHCDVREDHFMLHSADRSRVTNPGPANARFTVIGLKPVQRYVGYEP